MPLPPSPPRLDRELRAFAARRADIARSARALVSIYTGTSSPHEGDGEAIPTNGHTDFLAASRCHDDQHLSQTERASSKTQPAINSWPWMTAPKIRADLGLEPAPSQQ
jgi:hypothetical protein